MEGNYIVIYTGKLNPDVSLEYAIEQLSLAFKMPKENAKEFISTNKPRIIKKNLTIKQAKKYHEALTKAGLEIKINQGKPKITDQANQVNKNKELNNGSNNLRNDQFKRLCKEKPSNLDSNTIKEKKINRKHRIRIALSILVICILAVSGIFLTVTQIITHTYTQEETYRDNNIWYEKNSKKPLNGFLETRDRNGNLKSKIPFKNGLIHGVFKSFYSQSNSIASEITYVKGKKHGAGKAYSEEGYIIGEETYNEDKRDGKSKTYHNSGKLESLTVFDNEQYVLMEMYDSSGQLFHRIEFENGKKSHEYTYRQGKLDDETNYRNGAPETIHHHNK